MRLRSGAAELRQFAVRLFSNDGVLGGDTAVGEQGEEFGG